jgi:hypothetical protein
MKSFTSIRVSQKLGTYQKLNSDLEKRGKKLQRKRSIGDIAS